MASSTLEALADGTRVFIDANIFVYHFTGTSPSCRDLLLRCERGELRGMTSVVVLAEVAHRLMMVEAVAEGLVNPGNVVRKLRDRPHVVQQLHLYEAQVDRIPLMGIDVHPLDTAGVSHAMGLCHRVGLMTNDGLVAAAAMAAGAEAIASADRDFERIPGLPLYRPNDLPT